MSQTAASPNLIVLSNGYGEDSVGALLLEELLKQRPQMRVAAFPTVDRGRAYERLDIPILGPRQTMPSGGLLMHSKTLFIEDMRAGFLNMTLQQLSTLRKLTPDALIVIGDIFALLLSGLIRTPNRFQVQTLVSAHHQGKHSNHPNRYFMERIAYPERALMRHLVRHVYVRDKATESFLQAKGVGHVSARGNPMLDAVKAKPMPEHSESYPNIALLPGTRRYAPEALLTMLETLAHEPGATGLVAWAGGDLPTFPESWTAQTHPLEREGLRLILEREGQLVFIYEGRFAEVLHSSHIALGTAGTANEQAAALGKPVVTFAVPPLYSETFLLNQKRLLADALSIAPAQPETIAKVLRQLLQNPERAAQAGQQRMGEPGGAANIVRDILSRLNC